MDTYNKYRIRVTAVKNKVEHDSFVDLISKSSFENVSHLVKMQLSRSLRFPYTWEIEQLSDTEFLYQAVTNIFEVARVVTTDFANIFYGA